MALSEVLIESDHHHRFYCDLLTFLISSFHSKEIRREESEEDSSKGRKKERERV